MQYIIFIIVICISCRVLSEEKIITVCTTEQAAMVYLDDVLPEWLTLKAESKKSKKYTLTTLKTHKSDQIVQLYFDWFEPYNHDIPMSINETDAAKNRSGCVVSYPNVIYPHHVIRISCPDIEKTFYFNLDKSGNGHMVQTLMGWPNIMGNGQHKNKSNVLDAGNFTFAKCKGVTK